eukprot:Sspe_Gene.45436::Locus_22494_Transcript_1_1_Confidence_1.000_Length_1124::g.45436::m.45436
MSAQNVSLVLAAVATSVAVSQTDIKVTFTTCQSVPAAGSGDQFEIYAYGPTGKCYAGINPESKELRQEAILKGCGFSADEVKWVSIATVPDWEDDAWCIEEVLLEGNLLYEHDQAFFWVDYGAQFTSTDFQSSIPFRIRTANLTRKRQRRPAPVETVMAVTLHPCTPG